MELLETNQRYRLFTKNDRGIGAVIYHRNEDDEDIVFKPYFREPGDPWIGALYDSVEKEEWKTSRELFGRYLDDPYFRIGSSTIKFVIRPEIKPPEWMGSQVLVLVEFDNEGAMVCRYGAEKTGVFLVSGFEYKGEMTIKDTLRFAHDKLSEEETRVEFLINTIEPQKLIPFRPEDYESDDEGDDFF